MSRPQFAPSERVSHYTVERLLGQGGFGDIYLVRDSRNMKDYAMKTELLTSAKQVIQNEINLLTELKLAYFPAVRGYGEATHCRYFVMDILGPSISAVRRRLESRRLGRVVGMAVAEETLRIIQALHELGMIHRDVKPSNFLLRPHSNAPLCLIDFGLAKRRRDCSKSCQPGERRFTGTVKYASPNAHKGMELAPRDDLYSWFYSMVELMGHNLPWENVKDQTECLRQKTVIDVTELCGNLPEKFKAIYGCILGLTYEEIPNYRRIFDLLNDARIEDRIPSDGAEWQALMRVIPEAIQLVPEETEQLGAPARRRRTAVDVGAPLISNDDGAHCPACFLL